MKNLKSTGNFEKKAHVTCNYRGDGGSLMGNWHFG